MLSAITEFLDIGVIRMACGLTQVILDQIGGNGIRLGGSVLKSPLIKLWESLV